MKLTEFQRGIMKCMNTCTNGMADMWEIAQRAFPDKWTKKKGRSRSGRGALVANLRRACSDLADKGLLIVWASHHNSTMAALPHRCVWDDEKQQLVHELSLKKR